MSVGTDARQRGLLLIAAAAMFVVLLAGELSHEDEALTLQDALFEILQLSLLIGCSVTSTLLALRVQAQEEEGQDLRREIELVRARNEEWRQGMSAHLRELGAAIRAQFET
ncbi:MAG TPA: hypothetical protein VFY87_03405 [Geminicoccaceae bacterium]|nr:hypothetical protein [Geminicoccaceae bacterium]